jgi:hypothetical protein
MGERGPKSAASLSVASINDAREVQRLAPPLHLSEAERSLWLRVVGDQAPGAFTVTHEPLLELYVRHVTQARLLADEIANFQREWLADDDGLKRFDRMLAMAEREGRAASSLATRLRITRQAIDPKTAARLEAKGRVSRRPWDTT